MKTKLLEVKNLSIGFNQKYIVNNISFSLNQGQSMAIVGESGSGKSLTALSLLGLLPNNSFHKADKMEFDNSSLINKSYKNWQKIRGQKISMIFQDPIGSLNPCLNIKRQIVEVLKLHRSDLNKRDYMDTCIEILKSVKIADPIKQLKSYPHQLSGGMCQRIMIAMAIAAKPKLLIADEPTTALDVTIQKQILILLKELQKKNNMSLILISHDLAVVSHYTKCLNVMYKGEFVEKGETDTIINNPMHPYTQGLLNSIPTDKLKFREELKSIPYSNKNSYGCKFSPRCKYVQDKCKNNIPIYISNNNQDVLCFYPVSEK